MLSDPIKPMDALSEAARRHTQELYDSTLGSRLRKPDKRQLQALKDNIERFGCVVPVLATGSGEIIDGHMIWEACKALKLRVPTIRIDHLNEGEVRALRISLNKIAELSTWDETILKQEMQFLAEFDPLLLAATAFEMPVIDQLLDPGLLDEDAAPEKAKGPATSRPGDLWLFDSGHRLLCADAKEPESYATLMAGRQAQLLATDPPYGCKIAGNVSRKHDNFVEGCELSPDEVQAFCQAFLACAVPVLDPGALSYVFMDGRGLRALFEAVASNALEYVDLCIWDKVNPGMGSFYRQQSEHVVVSKKPGGKTTNNIMLGRHGRNRSNIWTYPGMAGFGPARKKSLDIHPTVKPIGLMTDIMLDASHRGDIVLEPFSGSGTTLIAAQRTGRMAYALELDPAYVDVAIIRMQQVAGQKARHAETGRSFDEIKRERLGVGEG